MIKRLSILLFVVFLQACSSSSSSGGGGNAVTRILAIGDSIGTTEYVTTPWPDRIAQATGAELINRSRGGYTTSQFVGSVGRFLDQDQPSHMVILLGTNDANNRFSPSFTFANLQRMVNEGVNRGVTVIVGTTPSILGDPSGNALTAEMANLILGLSGAKIADTRGALGSDPTVYADNFLHPNDAGEDLIANAFLGQL